MAPGLYDYLLLLTLVNVKPKVVHVWYGKPCGGLFPTTLNTGTNRRGRLGTPKYGLVSFLERPALDLLYPALEKLACLIVEWAELKEWGVWATVNSGGEWHNIVDGVKRWQLEWMRGVKGGGEWARAKLQAVTQTREHVFRKYSSWEASTAPLIKWPTGSYLVWLLKGIRTKTLPISFWKAGSQQSLDWTGGLNW